MNHFAIQLKLIQHCKSTIRSDQIRSVAILQYKNKVASVVSDSVRPHRRQPTRLPSPWDSSGKNTGVGCHFLLQCMKVKSESEVSQLCQTLSDPTDSSLPGSSVHGIFQARVLEWGTITFSACMHTHTQTHTHGNITES